jgi:hypothetical protein
VVIRLGVVIDDLIHSVLLIFHGGWGLKQRTTARIDACEGMLALGFGLQQRSLPVNKGIFSGRKTGSNTLKKRFSEGATGLKRKNCGFFDQGI